MTLEVMNGQEPGDRPDVGNELSNLPPEVRAKVEQKLNGILSEGSFDKMFTMQEMVSAIKEIIHIGDEPRDLYMRADFFDDEQAVDAAGIEADCEEFHNPTAKRQLHNTMAARTAVKGKRIAILERTITGSQQQAQKPQGIGGWMKQKAGIG